MAVVLYNKDKAEATNASSKTGDNAELERI